MKILIISNMYPSKKDPVYGTFVKEFTESIKFLNVGGKTKLIAVFGREKSKAKKIYQYLKFYNSIFFELLFRKYDIIYVHTITFPIIPIRIVSYIKSLPLVFNVHGIDLLGEGKIPKILRRIAKPLLNKSLSIISPSNYFKTEIKKFLPDYSQDKIFVSPSGGVNTELFRPNKIFHEHFTIGFVSRIDKGKGWNLYIEAFVRLKKEYSDLKGIIAGRGAQTGKMLDMLNRLELAEDIKYVGPIPHDKLPQIFNQCNLFIFPTTTTESLGLVGIEALSCGVPVIASNRYGPTDYIMDHNNGILFKIGDINDLVAKIGYYYNLSVEEKDRYSINARQSAMAYDERKIMKDLYSYLLTIA